MMSNEAEGKTRVAAISEMDKEKFCRHMTIRHQDSLAGMSELPVTITEPDEGLYRSFHKRLHETRVDLGHEHERGTDPNNYWQDQA
jgi:hypothetical protein